MIINLSSKQIFDAINSLPKFSRHVFLSEIQIEPGLQVAKNFKCIEDYLVHSYEFGFILMGANDKNKLKSLFPEFVNRRTRYINKDLLEKYFTIDEHTEVKNEYGTIRYTIGKNYLFVQFGRQWRFYPYLYIKLDKNGNALFHPNDEQIKIDGIDIIDSPEARRWQLEHL
jgi:hypothetical protein